jgi:hypothetical protein
MNRVLEYFEQKRRVLEQRPFLAFVRDRSIKPEHRLSFAPCMAPMTMGFSDLMVLGLRDLSSTNELQRILNEHTRVDDRHWEYFVHDLTVLGFNGTGMNLSEALLLLWGEHCARTRQVSYTFMAIVRDAPPIMRLVILEMIEIAADLGFSLFRQVGKEYTAETGQALQYFGQPHQDLEDEHSEMGASSIRSLISSYPWTEEEEKQAFAFADEVTHCFIEMGNDLLAYAQKSIDHGPLWPLDLIRSRARNPAAPLQVKAS